MPRAALDAVEADHVVPAAKIGPLLGEITARLLGPGPEPEPDPLLDAEVAVADFVPVSSDHLAPPAGFGCPTCGGSLFQIEERPIPRFRCRVGHAWSPETLLDEQAEALEGALWMALRALREKAELSRRMAAGGRGHFLERAEEAEAAAATLGELIARLGATAAN